jgi:hypothetical protein
VDGALKEVSRVQLRADEQSRLLLQHLGQHGEEAVDNVGPVRQAGRRLDISAGNNRSELNAGPIISTPPPPPGNS